MEFGVEGGTRKLGRWWSLELGGREGVGLVRVDPTCA